MRGIVVAVVGLLSSSPPPPTRPALHRPRSQTGPAGWAGPVYPNASSAAHSIDVDVDCGTAGCLFNVTADPGEHNDLAASMPAAVAALGARLDELALGIWENEETGTDACPPNTTGTEPCACWMAWHRYGGFLGACVRACVRYSIVLCVSTVCLRRCAFYGVPSTVRACVRACVCVCVRACVHACVRACVRAHASPAAVRGWCTSFFVGTRNVVVLWLR